MCIVFGDPSVASEGRLVCVPAGLASSVARILPYLTGVIAQGVIDLSGEEPGQASLLKMIGNVMILSTMEMVAEVNVFAEKVGLGTANAQKLVESFPKAASTLYSKRMNGGGYHRDEVLILPFFSLLVLASRLPSFIPQNRRSYHVTAHG